MNALDLEKISQDDILPITIESLSIVGSYLSINEKIALPIYHISAVYDTGEDIPVVDEKGDYLGTICFCKGITNFDLNQLTEWRLVAYLTELETDKLIPQYKFQHNYLVLDESKYEEYEEHYLETSTLWGKFTHTPVNTPYKYKEETIIAKKVNLPEPMHKESNLRAIIEPYAFERYLKNYHLLELYFDYDLVEQIRGLPDDLKGVGKLMAEYRRDDINRLKSIISKCTDIDSIAKKLTNIKHYQQKAQEIFYEYGKESNPLQSIEHFIDITNATGFNLYNVERVTKKREKDYPQLILNLAAYWIYRVRCCIAHNKIGEYIMVYEDEPFMVDFAEPLLQEILAQVYKK